MLKVYTQTDIGLVRSSNQDACDGGLLSESAAAWAVVCDGMGGANGGNIASQMAVEHITSRILSYPPESLQGDSVKNMLLDAVHNANMAVYEKAKSDGSLRGMGTTVVVALVFNGVAHVIHAGDSRAYLLNDQGIQQLTMDHSMVQELVNHGDLTEQEAKFHPQKNIITRALGVLPAIELDYCECGFATGSRLLVCTDGLTNYVEIEKIHQLSKESDADGFCKKLVSMAIDGGGGDNVTVAVIEN